MTQDEELDTLEKAMRLAAADMLYLPPHLTQQAATAITALRAQLAEQKRFKDRIIAEASDALVAAPEVMHEDAPAAIVGEIGNQIHNLGCELQNDEDVSLRLSELACRCWDVAKLFPTDRTALDRMLAEAREKALREAAEILDDEGWLGMSMHRIRALIEVKP